MMKTYLMGLTLLCCVGCNNSSPSLNKLADDAVILAFGDSLTYGTGAATDHDYPSILAQLSGKEVINAGVPGEISAEGRQRLPALLDEYRPSLLILIHGGNDILRQLPAEQTRDNLNAMVADAKQRGIQVLMLGVPKFGLLMLRSAEFYADVAQSGAIVSDLETLPDILASNELKADTVHPNDKGYRRLAENIASLLKQQGAL